MVWCASDELEDPQARKILEAVDGVLVPGGFGIRGVEGKVEAIRFARERRVPYLGICLGLQTAVIEIARNLAGLEGANSSEFEADTPYPVIDLLPDQRRIADKGGTMRLGLDPCRLLKGSRAERPTATGWCSSGTATATRSTTASGAGWRTPGWSSPGPRPTAAWSR